MEGLMEIPLNAQVECSDGICGRSAYVLINPVTEEVTHVVVKEDASPNTEYLVPVDIVGETIAETIQLHCTKAELEKMNPFIKATVIERKVADSSFAYGAPDRGYAYGNPVEGNGPFYYLPFVVPQVTMDRTEYHPQIPMGELAVQRGARVEATDGYVGNVDEFVVNPENCHITHLVMREGHLWGQKDVIIPLSAMGDIRQDTVFLKLDKAQIEALPTFPLNRRWS
jgi:hypothetical protein